MTQAPRLALLVLVLAVAAGSLFLWNPRRVLSQGPLTSDVPAVWAGLGFVLVFAIGTLAFAALAVPARRALGVDPTITLRAE